eukprot:1772620-Alexandrium_andersonii.AAC.1
MDSGRGVAGAASVWAPARRGWPHRGHLAHRALCDTRKPRRSSTKPHIAAGIMAAAVSRAPAALLGALTRTLHLPNNN